MIINITEDEAALITQGIKHRLEELETRQRKSDSHCTRQYYSARCTKEYKTATHIHQKIETARKEQE